MCRPTISCVCPTHGRAHFVNEALGSFVRQEIHGFTAELLVYSDCPEQILECDLPNVRVINVDPIPDLSIKFNKAVGEARGEYIAWWEDDDISLPFRLRSSLEGIRVSGKCYWKQDSAWFLDSEEMTMTQNLFFGNSIFVKESYIESGGAAEGRFADLSAHESMIAHCGMHLDRCAPSEAYFIYRWGGMGHHDSGISGTNADRFRAFRDATLASPDFVPGRVSLLPVWKRDYCAIVVKQLKEEK